MTEPGTLKEDKDFQEQLFIGSERRYSIESLPFVDSTSCEVPRFPQKDFRGEQCLLLRDSSLLFIILQLTHRFLHNVNANCVLFRCPS